MTPTLREILDSPAWRETVDRVRSDLTATVMAKNTHDGDREAALLKYHLLDALLVDLSSRSKE